MARSFSSQEARSLRDAYEEIYRKAQNCITNEQKQRSVINASIEAYISKAVMDILRNKPVEEINRDKTGIRVKALYNHGYSSIADLVAVTPYQLSAIKGIGDTSARKIHGIVLDIVNETKQGIQIRINADKQTKESAELVRSISVYRNNKENVTACREIIAVYEKDIAELLQELTPGTGAIRWLFSSGTKKQNAADAYQKLQAMLAGEYASNANRIFSRRKQVDATDIDAAWQDFRSHSVQFYTILEEIAPDIITKSNLEYGLPEELAREIRDEEFFPDGLLCTLRRYQEWGVKYALHQKRILLGDEMGLGKTVQAIATMVSLKNTGATHFVVVCPASVLTNWCREIKRHSRLSVTKVHGNYKEAALRGWMRSGGVAVTTYETTGIFDFSENFKFTLCVVDEAHYIKNTGARRSQNVRKLCKHAERLLFMTGTALENNVREMVSLIDVLQPETASKVKEMVTRAHAPEFRTLVAPVYYRRKRIDVLAELPELIENKEWCTLGAIEQEAYESSLGTRNFMAVRRVSWNVDDLAYSSKAARMMEIIDEAREDNRKVIVFSFFLDTLNKVRSLLKEQCVGLINGSIPPHKRQEIIDLFESAPDGSVLVAQIQSGGTGLNIQSASVVIICEPQFKPSIENQAISRAYRMGQTRNVLVYRLLCENTVDERLVEILEDKQEIFDAFADRSEAAESAEKKEISNSTFNDIIQEEIDRINAQKEGAQAEITEEMLNEHSDQESFPEDITDPMKEEMVSAEDKLADIVGEDTEGVDAETGNTGQITESEEIDDELTTDKLLVEYELEKGTEAKEEPLPEKEANTQTEEEIHTSGWISAVQNGRRLYQIKPANNQTRQIQPNRNINGVLIQHDYLDIVREELGDEIPDALKKQIKDAEDHYKTFAKKNRHISVRTAEDFIVEDPLDIVSMSIEADYTEPLPDLTRFSNLKSLIIKSVRSWKELGDGLFYWIDELIIKVATNDLPENLYLLHVKKLSISFVKDTAIGGDNIEPIALDFVGMDNLEELNLYAPPALDYSVLNQIPNLRKLHIRRYGFNNIRWIADIPKIKQLLIDGPVTDLTGITSQTDLKELYLYGTALYSLRELQSLHQLEQVRIYSDMPLDLSPLDGLQKLNVVEIRSDHILDEGSLRENNIEHLSVTEEDRDREKVLSLVENSIQSDVSRLISQVHYRAEHRDDTSTFVKQMWDKEQSLSKEQRVKNHIQKGFENHFYEVSPSWYFHHYRTDLKQEYLKEMQKRYPFLYVTDEMNEQIELEKKRATEVFKNIPGRVAFLDGDLYILDARVKPGQGEIVIQNPHEGSVRVDPVFKKNLFNNLVRLMPNHIASEHDYMIGIISIYHSSVSDPALALPALLAVMSYLNNKPVIDGTVLMDRFASNGRLKRTESVKKRDFKIAVYHGFKTCVFAGDQNKWNRRGEQLQMKCYQNEQELIANMFGEYSTSFLE